MAGTAPPAPTCPRCGYDQSGVVATWAESCPIAGVCSECGEKFEWAVLFDRDRGLVRGFFEHAKGWRRWIAWSLVTFAWTIVPAVFWRRIGPDEPPLRRRVWTWPIVAAAVPWVIGSMTVSGANLIACLLWSDQWHWSGFVNAWTLPFAVYVNTTEVRYWTFEIPDEWLSALGISASLALAWPAVIGVFAMLPRLERPPRAWFIRAVLYSLAWLPALAWVTAVDSIWWLTHFHFLYSYLTGSLLEFWSPSDLLLPPFPWAAAVWLAAWWWCALSRLLGRREAVRFWIAGVVFGGIAAVFVDAAIQIRLAQAP